MVWNVHSFLPVRTSNARTSPLTFSLLGAVPPCVSAGPITMTPFETTGGELLPILPIGSSGDAAKTWQIPICVRYPTGKKETKVACTLVGDREGDVPLEGACPAWVMPNADAIVFPAA